LVLRKSRQNRELRLTSKISKAKEGERLYTETAESTERKEKADPSGLKA
jgi:hypothetical protein